MGFVVLFVSLLCCLFALGARVLFSCLFGFGGWGLCFAAIGFFAWVCSLLYMWFALFCFLFDLVLYLGLWFYSLFCCWLFT